MTVAESLNPDCPFSGKAVQANSLVEYRGKVVGFCNPECRDKFAANPRKFPDALAKFNALIDADSPAKMHLTK